MSNVYIKTVEGGENTAPSSSDAVEIDDGTNSEYVQIGNLYNALGLNNYQISASVVSDDLVVALKTISGDDASDGDSILFKIDDTYRKITAALSVTVSAGANVFNAGGTELLGNAVGLFVYIGYNATDGVTLGISRISSATTYSDFSATSTAETYAAISDISHAGASDTYQVIGYFEAENAGTAGFEWSGVANVENKPRYHTNWLDWTPAYSASESLTFTSVSTTMARYRIEPNTCRINIVAAGTLGGSASTVLYATLPFDGAQAANNPAIGAGNTATVAAKVTLNAGTPDQISWQKYDTSNYATSGSCTVKAAGDIEI